MNKKSTSASLTLMTIFLLIGLVFASVWIAMLVWGALASKYNWWQFGYWETFGVAFLLLWAGNIWHGSSSSTKNA